MSEEKDIIGSLFEDDEPVGESPSIELSEDRMHAYVIIPPKPLAVDVRELLSELGITFGIDTGLISTINKNLYDGIKMEPRYEVAKGVKAVVGQQGELILRTKKPEDLLLSSEDLTKVDYKVYKVKMLAIAEKEKPVAMIIDPTKGNDGMDIFGNVVEGPDGEEVEIDLGPNVYRSGRKLVSKIDGLIEYKKGKDGKISFDVSEIYLVRGDVDYNTGNIDFPGSVIVKGNIKAGFGVAAKNEVVAETIRGSVKAGSSVVAKQGIIGGTDLAHIEAGGAVYAKFVQNAKIISGDSVDIKKSIVMSEIYAEGSVTVGGSPGTIIGGSIYAVKGIEAKIYGSESFVKTEVALYKSAKDVILLRDITSKRYEVMKNLLRIDTYLGAGREELLNGYAGNKQELISKLIKKRDHLRRELLEKNLEMKAVQRMLVRPVEGSIVVGKEVWPEVRASISGKFILVKNEKGKGRFFYNKDEDLLEFK